MNSRPIPTSSLAFSLLACLLLSTPLHAAELRTRNVILITTDGLRWEEVFTGAEKLLISKDPGGVGDTNTLAKKFWRETPAQRREALLPFLWQTVAKQGQLLGNKLNGSIGRVTNGRNFSYPGYNEFLTGAADPRIDSNSKIPNPNTNVFEWLNRRPGYSGKVAAIVNWDVIPWILNTERSQLPVWSGFPLPADAPSTIKLPPIITALAGDTTPLWGGVTADSITQQAALHHIKTARPRALYIAYAETDEWAHEGRYDRYLHSAHHMDRFIRQLWETVQAIPQYRNQTTFVITTDHGRGIGPTDWKSHGEKLADSAFIWAAVIGPDTQPLGERSNIPPFTQSQIAPTVAAFLGEDFHAAFPNTALPIAEVLAKPTR